MKSQLQDFKDKLNNVIENKTDRYWLDQVRFDVGSDGNLNIYVGSEFIKNSIEKKVLKNIEKVYKTTSPGFDCVFILDKSFVNNPVSVDVIEERVEEEPVEETTVVEEEPVQEVEKPAEKKKEAPVEKLDKQESSPEVPDKNEVVTIKAEAKKLSGPTVLGKMLGHALTDKGLKAFLDDWKKLQSENASK